MEALGINIASLVTQLVSFLILFALLYALLYKPVLGMLDRRSARIKESLESAEKASEEAGRSREEIKAELDAARAEGMQMIEQSREAADRYREEELAKAREEISAERERAEVNIQRERDAAIEEIRKEFAGLAITAAEKIVKSSLDEQSHRDLIDSVLEEGPTVGKS